MKILHTSDWHVGKTIRGRSRLDEHRAVLAEVAAVSAEHEADLVVVAGDLFETAAPSPESEEIVFRALLDLANTGAEVAVIAGNHDHPRRLQAVAPLLELGRVHLVTQPRAPDDGGVLRITCQSGDEVAVAMLPFVSQRGIVRSEQLMDDPAFQNAQLYSDRMRVLIESLAKALPIDVPTMLIAHAFVLGGQAGGGERPAHLANEYAVPVQAFPASIGYVALGHLHRPQQLPGATSIHYSGSLLQLDFGEEQDAKQVNVVSLEVGEPAAVKAVKLSAGRRLRTLSGSQAELSDMAQNLSDESWLRVRVREASRAGLADRVREILGDQVVDVQLVDAKAPVKSRPASRRNRSPQDLFAAFMEHKGLVDQRLTKLFAELYDAEQEVRG